MTDEYKNDILYVPHTEPDRDYRSEGEFPPEERETVIPIMPDPEPVPDDTPGKIIEDLGEVSEIIQGLPEDLQFLRPSIDRLVERIKVVWPDGTNPPSTTIKYTPMPPKKFTPIIRSIPLPDDPDIPDVPNGIPNLVPINIKMESPKTALKLVQDGYKSDTIRLTQYYLQQLQLIMQKYFQQMIAAMHDCHLDDIDNLTKDFDGNFVKVPSGKNLEHLRDFICRSQTERKQKSMLFRKTHSVDNTLIHMRAWHMTAKEQERYYSEKYVDSGTYSSSHSNSLLRESRKMYDAAYDSALYNMYKYLNSATLLTNDILEATAKEAQAKAQLINEGVDIFAFDEEEAAARAGGTAGNGGQAGDGTGSGFDSAASSSSSSDSSSTQSSGATSGESSEGSSGSGGSSSSKEGSSSGGGILSGLLGDGKNGVSSFVAGGVGSLSSGAKNLGLPFGQINLDSINNSLGKYGVKIGGNGQIADIIKQSNQSLAKIDNIAKTVSSGAKELSKGVKAVGAELSKGTKIIGNELSNGAKAVRSWTDRIGLTKKKNTSKINTKSECKKKEEEDSKRQEEKEKNSSTSSTSTVAPGRDDPVPKTL